MIFKWDATIPPLSGKKPRRGYVYLPDSYNDEPQRRYPVLYMFDGHNVFFDSDATYGKSWGINAYMRWTKKPLIIVAIECNHEGNRRLIEYSPLKFETASLGKIDGKGKVYMDWLVSDLKPFIDARFRTLPDRENTLICGSSMGGLMAMYAAVEYSRYFGRAACLSPSVWVAPDKLSRMIARANVRKDTLVYMDYGSEELGNHAANREALTAITDALRSKGISLSFRIIPGGTHSEASWEKQIPVFMECFGI